MMDKFFPAIRNPKELRTELVRKSLHVLIALVPLLAGINRPLTIALLLGGSLLYSLLELLRLSGFPVPVISTLTALASRRRDQGHFVRGPVTLGAGALLALLLYPPQAASIAVYTLAFGDGIASLVGKTAGRIRPSFLLGKSVEGSLACFTVSFIAAYRVSLNCRIALLAAMTGTLVDIFPLGDYDNLVMPLAVGLAVRDL
ncbi:MAG: phosphatidate cytidylyltransferase [Spirochaetaceae bacterium]|jgi:dolichol kinase|nr:phosphatidate cytidylyltransferase [Spirochaetaceae bacterium]